MRILRFLVMSFVLVAIIGGVIGLITREALVLMGASQIRSSLSELQYIAKNATEYVVQCRQKGTPIDQVAVAGLQLRFTSSTEYVTEVLCNQFLLDPITVSTKSLPPLVQKVPGSAGIIFGDARSAVTVSLLGRKRSVVMDSGVSSVLTGSTSLGVSPITTCSGFGYSCCQVETYSGVGDPYAQVSDCPRSCFSQCLPRPLILSFVSDPFPEGVVKTILTTSGQTVSYSFVASYDGPAVNKKTPVTVIVDFGDGQQQNLSTLSGQADHIYACTQPVDGKCQYTAQVKAVLPSGIESAATPLTKINVIVTAQ